MSVDNVFCPFCKAKSFCFPIEEIAMFLCHSCQRYMPYEHAKKFGSTTKISVEKSQPIVNYSSLLTKAKPINTLPSDHFARVFLQNRKLPLEDLYFVENFNNFLKNTKYEDKVDSGPKIIIPLRSKHGLYGVQARKLTNQEGPKYITIKFVDCETIFGRDKIDITKPVYVVEGPFDSMFLDNAIAVVGAGVKKIDFESDFVYCLDNEPRNKSIISIMSKLLKDNKKVVIWPETIRSKDINDMHLQGIDVKSIVKNNIHKGPKGLIKLSSWKKI